MKLRGFSGLSADHRWQHSTSAAPTFIKAYPCRPDIKNRVFIPKPEASRPGRLPLYISVHGGGFIAGTPELDDVFCSQLSKTHGICVVAIGYRKSPRWVFPTAIQDIAAIALSIIEGDSLPIDPTRVAIGGFSTGASLALAAVQTPAMKGLIHGVVGFNPITDMTIPAAVKLSNVGHDEKVDRLGTTFCKLVQWASLPPGTDLSDPLISPIFAERLNLPGNVFLIGAELDMMCAEAERMSMGLAIYETGTQAGNENDWEKGGVRWIKMIGYKHAFTHIKESGDRETERRAVVEELFHQLGLWLWEKVYV
ncbi:MAG: alpha/beta hydrolase fold domain-containing protein [Janthinobacterium lividum]